MEHYNLVLAIQIEHILEKMPLLNEIGKEEGYLKIEGLFL